VAGGDTPRLKTGVLGVIKLSVTEARTLIEGALVGAGAAPERTGYFADAILDTELSGLEGHGFYWLQFYCAHLRSGKVDRAAEPRVERLSDTAFRVHAANGFAHPAIEAGFKRLIPAAKKYGVAAMAVHRSYNAATLGYHTGVLAKEGLVALGATNSVPAIAPVGGNKPVIGTNPISFAVPGRPGEIAFLIDQSASAIAWTAVKRAAEENRPIPVGWALDANGNDTTDARKGLEGSMAPAGGAKGFGIGLMVEVLCAALAGGVLGPDMGSFVEDDGKPIGNGQFFVAFEPGMFSGDVFAKRIEALCASIGAQEGARLPNARRTANKARLEAEGLPIERSLYERLQAYRR
jgi:(2R)-3-sulfolactate dehydrogenase (NADP+)